MIINLMAAITNKELLLLLMIVIIVFIVLLTALGIIFITVLRKRKPIVKVVMSPNGMEDRPQVAQGQQADRIIEPARNNGPAIPEPTRIVDPDHIVDPTPVAATAQSSEPVHIVEAVVVEPVPVVEPTPEVEEEVVEEPATEVEEEVVEEPAAEVEEEVVEEPAAEVEEEVVEEPAAEVEEEVVEEPAAEVEEEVVEEPAAEVEEEVVEEPAAEVEEEVVEEEPEVQSVQPIPLFIPDLVEDESEEEDEEEAAEEVTEVEEEETVVRSVDEKTGLTITVRYRKSFTAKLIQSKDETKAFYTYLKNVLLSYKKVKSRISWGQENFNHGRNNIVRFTMRGKSLCLYFALNPDDYAETKYKVERAESKKYEEIPCMYRIKNGRRAKYAVDLIAAVMEKFGIPYGAEQNENYYKPYETTEQLIEEGLIKKVVKEETFTEYVVTEEAQPIAEEQLVEEAASVEEVAAEVAPEAIEEVSEEIAPEAVEEPVAAVEEVTEEPAKEAEEEVIEEEAEAEEFEEVIDPEQAEIIEQSKQEIEQKLRETVTAAEVNSYISDEVTVSLVKKKRTDNVRLKGEKAIVNIDTLSENFRRGERVNLEKLKAKKLVGKNVVSVKVLARGALTKPLTVEAHDFSMEAMKMIIITGGTVIKA